MQDVWAFNLNSNVWVQVDQDGIESFKPKRFHSSSAISSNRMLTFGGCFAEYVHMNDLNIFDFDQFVKSDGTNKHVTCTKVVDYSGQIPHTRWGHSASVF